MYRTTMAFPVKAGATPEEIASVAEMFRDRPDDYREARSSLGISLERAYHQPTPMGDFVVSYVESEAPAAETFGRLASSTHPLNLDFIRMVNEIHGVDVTAPPQGPPPETIGVWTDPDSKKRGKGLAFCAPAIPGSEDIGRSFIHEAFETRRDQMTASRRALRQRLEVVTLQETPMGPIVCVYLEGEDPVEGNRGFSASTGDFDMWFKGQLATVFPPEVDLRKPLPPVTEIFDSEALISVRKDTPATMS